MNVFVFDIETVPDVESGRRLYGNSRAEMDKLSDEEVAKIMFQQRSQETEGRTEMLRHHLQKIVAIAGVLNSGNIFKIGSLCEPDSPEKDLIQRFFEVIQRTTPKLVSWNGGGFDLPVLHYRALLHGVTAKRYWSLHGEDPAGDKFHYNNYMNRYHERHTDLMDVLAGYQSYAFASLDHIATMLGLPGKLGMSGDKVWDKYLTGGIQEIRYYCETDALNTYLIYLRFELMRGNFSQEDYARECQRVRDMLAAENKPHFKAFLEAWTG
jgi:hypothetical protein